MNASGNTAQEELKNNAKQLIDDNIEHDPSFVPIVDIVNKKKISARINNFRKEGFLSPKMDIQSTMDNEFDQGDLLFFDENYWLCTMRYNFHDIYYRGEVVQCNNIIRFQLPKSDGKIHEYNVIAERPYVVGLNKGNIIQTSDKEYKVRLQLDEITKKLFLKQRIMMGYGYNKDGERIPDLYTIDVRDSASNAIMMENGFLVLNFVADQYNKDLDSEEFMVADYDEPEEENQIIIPGTCDISTSNKFEVKLGSSFHKKFNAIIYDGNGKLITDYSNIEFNWSLICNDLQRKFLDIPIPENGVCDVRCRQSNIDKENDMLLRSKFELMLSANDVLNDISYGEIRKEIDIIPLI